MAILRLLGVLKVCNNVFLEDTRDVHVLHCGVSKIDTLLELSIFDVEILNDKSHVTEDVRVDDCADSDGRGTKEDLPLTQRGDVVAGK